MMTYAEKIHAILELSKIRIGRKKLIKNKDIIKILELTTPNEKQQKTKTKKPSRTLRNK